MYHPYFRGKQFELITIREMASLLAQSDFVPIIEPVRESLGGLERTLKAICDADGRAIVIVNPHYGDHGNGGTNISALLQGGFIGNDKISAGILLRGNTSFADSTCYRLVAIVWLGELAWHSPQNYRIYHGKCIV